MTITSDTPAVTIAGSSLRRSDAVISDTHRGGRELPARPATTDPSNMACDEVAALATDAR